MASAQVLTVSPQPSEGFVFLSTTTFRTGPCGIERGTPENRCTISPAAGALVTLTATANPPYQFLGWSGACSGTSTKTTVTVSTNITCTPHFTRPAYTQVSADGQQCAVTTIGTVQCWGEGSKGELGNGQNNDSLTPVTVQGISAAIAVTAGNDHSCALLMDKTARCWGSNSHGQLGIGTQGGIRNTPQAVVALSNVMAIDAGHNYTCAVREGGQMLCWGGDSNSGSSGALGLGNTITQTNTPTTLSGITNATVVATGVRQTCVLLNTGGSKCWGLNTSGLGTGKQLNRIPEDVRNLSDATAITVGSNHACALVRTGKAKCWGNNNDGRLGTGNDNHSATPADVTNLSTAVAISAGHNYTCALLADGSIKCWGGNNRGQLGFGGGAVNTPTTVPSITTAISVSAGKSLRNTCAILTDGNAYCWGDDYGNTPTLVPGQIRALTPSATIVLYKNHPFIIVSPYRAIPAIRVTRIPSWLQYSATAGVFFGTPGSTAASGITITPPSNPPLPLSPVSFSVSIQAVPTSLTIEDTDNRDNDIPTDVNFNAPLANPRLIAKGSDNKVATVRWSLISTNTPFIINAHTGILILTGSITASESYAITVQADFPTLEAAELQPRLPAVTGSTSFVINGVAASDPLKLHLKTFLEGPLQ